MFSVPSGKAGKACVSELARLFRSYADGSAVESIPLTVAMILPQLLYKSLAQNLKPMSIQNAWHSASRFGKLETSYHF